MRDKKKEELERIKKLKMGEGALEELSNFYKSLDEYERKEIIDNFINEHPELLLIVKKQRETINELAGIIGKNIIEAHSNMIENYLEVIMNTKTKKRKPKLKSVPETKKYDYASVFNSFITCEIMKEYKPEKISKNGGKIEVESKIKKNDIGEFSLIREHEGDIMETIIEKYRNNTLYFDRVEIQIFYALVSIYLQNTTRKQQLVGEAININTKDFHYNILGKKGHLQKKDLIEYERIFRSIATKRIHYTSNNNNSSKYRRYRNIKINANLLNVDIISFDDYKEQVIRIQPSVYTLFEMNKIKQFNNCLDWNIFKLSGRKEYDNVFYFYMYLSRLHRNNKKYNQKCFAISPFINTLVKESLPDGNGLINQFKDERKKKEFIIANIERPLKEAFNILENSQVVKPLKNRFNFCDSYKNIFDENEKNKIMIHFNYDL
ncbi:MAG: hypothetical protein WC346_17850 [Methanogenium sp.]|jgi:hypothetical protein